MKIEIRSMSDYWNSLSKIDRCSLMESLYILSDVGNMEWDNVPGHIKIMLYSKWNNKWKDQTHELTF